MNQSHFKDSGRDFPAVQTFEKMSGKYLKPQAIASLKPPTFTGILRRSPVVFGLF
ncbi:hypothetical protein NG796_04625 [Laspinema sp. A4]|uniref:hypothetical protein n=1 Tax=Laspinema sp. D2d TaxID=2953686 RepID=UPI0021BA5175|nr:hypothetical protein [Laspinema sp. D2d]MCT7982571.1 hypothetical protein [Laspinema sp. D2d]